MNQYRLSIVIPVYGVEKFILEFIQSIFPQLNEKIECIFIDDGSQDNSIKILEKEYNKVKDKQSIKIIYQKNMGIGAARNTGLKIAKGDFISFLDPDDIINDDYISTILNIIETQGDKIDLIHINADVLELNKKKSKIKIAEKTGLTTIDQNYLLQHFSKNRWQPWLRVFNKKILQDFSFPTNCILEDLMSFPFLYKLDINIYEINKELITYRLSNNNATSKKNDLYFKSYKSAAQLYQKHIENEYFKIIYFNIIDAVFNIKLRSNDFKAYNKYINEYQEHINQIKKFKNMSSKKKIGYTYPTLFYIYKTRFFSKKF